MAGLFITIEGIDGSGKTTQARLLVDWLAGLGHRVQAAREPGGTEAGTQLRDLVLSPERSISPEAELFLYLADRAINASEVVRPALAQERIVVCERHTDSTLAYQGYGRGLDIELLRRLNAIAAGGLEPDLTLVLDLPASQVRLDEARLDRLESEGCEFLARVANGFRQLAAAEPDRMKLIDAAGDVQAVHERIIALVRELLGNRPPSGERKREGP